MPNKELITADQVSLSGNDQVTISSNNLANALIRSQQNTISLVSENLAPISTEDIQIDEIGRVIIKNNEFRVAISKREELDRVSNGACGLNIVC